MGWMEYEPLAARYRVPIVVTGFEPIDILEGVLMAVRQLERGLYEVENQYVRSVTREGNRAAQEAMKQVFKVVDRDWRGIGTIAASGLALRAKFAEFDAVKRFGLEGVTATEPEACHAGDVLTGRLKPHECPAFGRECTPETPLGAPMVSTEGACAAYFNYGRLAVKEASR
jgi:hydrogenase expression/formation protein HypD